MPNSSSSSHQHCLRPHKTSTSSSSTGQFVAIPGHQLLQMPLAILSPPPSLRRFSFSASSPSSVLIISGLLLFLLSIGANSPSAHAVPVPMPFRRFFFLSANSPNPILLAQGTKPAASSSHPSPMASLADVQQILAEQAEEEEEERQMGKEAHQQKEPNQQQQQSSSANNNNNNNNNRAAALRGRIPMGPFDQWKRGGDFCGCNMGCFYHSVGQCASCCSLGL